MLTILILRALNIITSLILSIVPTVDLGDIPLIGISLRALLVNIMGYWNTAVETLPYLGTVWNTFLYVIIPFELGLIILKFFLGNRTPVRT